MTPHGQWRGRGAAAPAAARELRRMTGGLSHLWCRIASQWPRALDLEAPSNASTWTAQRSPHGWAQSQGASESSPRIEAQERCHRQALLLQRRLGSAFARPSTKRGRARTARRRTSSQGIGNASARTGRLALDQFPAGAVLTRQRGRVALSRRPGPQWPRALDLEAY
ncbi:unnamed protein product [Prorocentrum cordatum]|uniref:Uncharacterized protein n=1 Tax=Prorocentrum cordatum TaxID=2364126 RepID=A0ABN9UUU7_9DINO|nr:unnamed protein product [Polarella glacialis]